MKGSLETFEWGVKEKGKSLLRFSVDVPRDKTWFGVKDLDKFVTVASSSKGTSRRIIGSNGQPGSVYVCNYVTQTSKDKRQQLRSLKYVTKDIDDFKLKVCLEVSETINEREIRKSEEIISVEKHPERRQSSVVQIEFQEQMPCRYSQQYLCSWFCFQSSRAPYLRHVVSNTVAALILVVLSIYGAQKAAIKTRETTNKQLVELLRMYFMSYQPEEKKEPALLEAPVAVPVYQPEYGNYLSHV
eukprot:snap_masked-scaffold_16-processed-gene-1.25-mRNA-1 protein AED:1.00 eAED:1.00 QI:0/0/0/0/1/1/2/0/242